MLTETAAFDRAGEVVAGRGGGGTRQGGEDGQGVPRNVVYIINIIMIWILTHVILLLVTCMMSDSENESTVLGKRERDEQPGIPVADASTYDDQSDEDIGPMPIPSDANGTVKKKRKGD